MDKLRFGELELSILKAMEKLDRTTVRQVHETLGCQRSYTTIMTVMSRMVDKGDLKREKEGKHYIYWLPRTRSSPLSFLKRLQSKLFGDKLALVSYLIETDTEMSGEDLKEIEKLIKRRKAEKKSHG